MFGVWLDSEHHTIVKYVGVLALMRYLVSANIHRIVSSQCAALKLEPCGALIGIFFFYCTYMPKCLTIRLLSTNSPSTQSSLSFPIVHNRPSCGLSDISAFGWWMFVKEHDMSQNKPNNNPYPSFLFDFSDRVMTSHLRPRICRSKCCSLHNMINQVRDTSPRHNLNADSSKQKFYQCSVHLVADSSPDVFLKPEKKCVL